MIIEIKEEEIKSMDMSYAKELAFKGHVNFDAKPGYSEYNLYAWISNQFQNTTILDVGTRFGNSALSLSNNPSNKVVSYNIVEEGASDIEKENITWKIMDFRKDPDLNLDEVELIMIDVDPHDGKQEPEMLSWLKDQGWSGKILFDDIHHAGTKGFWASLEEDKQDLTSVGHMTGTGIIDFNKK